MWYKSIVGSCWVIGRQQSLLHRLNPACLYASQNRFNHYDTLGVKKTATQKEIKEAFIKLSKKHHPDVNNSASKKNYVKILEAYNILSKPETRQKYDLEMGQYKPWNEKYPPYMDHPDFNFARDLRYGRQYYDPEFAENLKRENEAIKAYRKKFVPLMTISLFLIYFILLQFNKETLRRSRKRDELQRLYFEERLLLKRAQELAEKKEEAGEWKRMF